MNKRIKELRETLGLSQAEFAESLNLKRNSISLIENGKRNPSDRTIIDICNKFNASEEWIRNGTGELFIKTSSDTMEQLKKEFNLDEFSYHLVYEYLKLGQEQRKSVRDFLYKIIDEEDTTSSELFEDDIPDTFEEMEKKLVKESIRSDVG